MTDIHVPAVSAIGRSTMQHAMDAIVRLVADEHARSAYLDAVAAFCIMLWCTFRGSR